MDLLECLQWAWKPAQLQETALKKNEKGRTKRIYPQVSSLQATKITVFSFRLQIYKLLSLYSAVSKEQKERERAKSNPENMPGIQTSS